MSEKKQMSMQTLLAINHYADGDGVRGVNDKFIAIKGLSYSSVDDQI